MQPVSDAGFWVVNAIFLGIAALLSYANIAETTLAVLCFLMVVDFMLGLTSAYVLKEPITSNKMKAGGMSKLATLMVVLAFGVTANLFLDFDFERYLTIVITVAALSELYSIVSHLTGIKTGERLPEWSAWALLGRSIRKAAEKILG